MSHSPDSLTTRIYTMDFSSVVETIDAKLRALSPAVDGRNITSVVLKCAAIITVKDLKTDDSQALPVTVPKEYIGNNIVLDFTLSASSDITVELTFA